MSVGVGRAVGGIITFGGGVPLYQDHKVIGGLGLSGDSACADHVIAYRMRKFAGFDGFPKGLAPTELITLITWLPAKLPTGSTTRTASQPTSHRTRSRYRHEANVWQRGCPPVVRNGVGPSGEGVLGRVAIRRGEFAI